MILRVLDALHRALKADRLACPSGIDAAKAFDIILIQTQGGPQNASTTLSLLIYRTMIRFGEPGLASAMSTVYLIGYSKIYQMIPRRGPAARPRTAGAQGPKRARPPAGKARGKKT